jgi:hypothetical protein
LDNLNTVLEARENAKQKINGKIQRYYNQQKNIYENNTRVVSYNVGGKVYIICAKVYADFIISFSFH